MKRTGFLILAGVATIAIVMADGTGSNAGLRRTTTGAVGSRTADENGLVGINLYNTIIDLVRKFGNPDDVQDVAGGGGTAVGPAGGGAGGGGGQGEAAGRGGGGPAGSASTPQWHLPPTNPSAFSTIGLFQGGDTPTFAGAGAGGQGGGGGAPGGQGGPTGAGPGGGGGQGGAQGQDTRILYTRWVYKRGNSRFGFIVDRFGRIIQIEAIGSNDSRVVTKRGIRYGAKFADIIRQYGVPDAYEISGNSLVVRYLVKNKVAFRLNRLRDDAPHVVTGIVVAAGKA